jgi:hypothetical protein
MSIILGHIQGEGNIQWHNTRSQKVDEEMIIKKNQTLQRQQNDRNTTYLSVTTMNVNGLNSPIKIVCELGYKTIPNHLLPIGNVPHKQNKH